MGKLHGPYGPSNWFEAKATCEGQDRKLLTIDSQEEEDKFRQIVEPSVVYVLNLPVKIVVMIIQSVTCSILHHNNTQENDIPRPKIFMCSCD